MVSSREWIKLGVIALSERTTIQKIKYTCLPVDEESIFKCVGGVKVEKEPGERVVKVEEGKERVMEHMRHQCQRRTASGRKGNSKKGPGNREQWERGRIRTKSNDIV